MEDFHQFIEKSELNSEDKAMWRTIFIKAPVGAIEAIKEYINESEEILKKVTEIIRLKKRALLENDYSLLEKALEEEDLLIR